MRKPIAALFTIAIVTSLAASDEVSWFDAPVHEYPDLEVRLKIPQEFKEKEDDSAYDYAGVFVVGDKRPYDLVISIRPLGHMLKSTDVRPSFLEDEVVVDTPARWKGLDLNIMRTTRESKAGVHTRDLVYIPTAPQALEVEIGGLRSPDDIRALTLGFLENLEGESNLLSSTERYGRIGRIAGLVVGLGIVVLVIVGLKFFRQ
jgi:hypothetical protein